VVRRSPPLANQQPIASSQLTVGAAEAVDDRRVGGAPKADTGRKPLRLVLIRTDTCWNRLRPEAATGLTRAVLSPLNE
jgi:hypothetical protein